MRYKVTKQYARGADSFCEAFADLQKARNYISEKLNTDINMNIKNITYKILEFDDEIEKYDASKAPVSTEPKQESQSSGGKGSGASFKPTPFNTTPRPKGGPQGWIKDEDDTEEK